MIIEVYRRKFHPANLRWKNWLSMVEWTKIKVWASTCTLRGGRGGVFPMIFSLFSHFMRIFIVLEYITWHYFGRNLLSRDLYFVQIKQLFHLKYPCDWVLAIKLPHINLRNVVGLQNKVGVSPFSIHLPCVLIMNLMGCIFTFRCLLYYENFQYFHDLPF